MRKVLAVATVALFCLAASTAYAEELKIGFINLKEVLDKYEKVTDGEDVLLKEAEDKNSEREKLVNEIKSMREKIELLKDAKKESTRLKEELIKKGETIREQIIIDARETSRKHFETKMKELDREIAGAEKKLEKQISEFSDKMKEIFING